MSRGDGLARLTAALQDHGCTMHGTSAQCPAHEDTRASLSVGQGRDGALVNCHAGCATDEVLETLGMSAADLFDEPREPGEARRGVTVAATYTYTDEAGAPLFYAERLDPKGFRQYRIVGGAKVWKLGDVRKVPYRLPGLLAAAADGGTVYVVEGEKDVHAVEAAGAVATCNPMGAGKWRAEYARYFAGAARVIIVADRDEPGRKHAAKVAASLRKAGVGVEVVEPAEGKDAADHLGAGHGLGQFRPAAEPAAAAQQDPAVLLYGAGTCVLPGTSDFSGDESSQVHTSYRQWFGKDYDTGALDVVLCGARGEQLTGDPAWVLNVAGSGCTKTETVTPLHAAGARLVSMLSGEQALLSATPAERRAKESTGGLLRELERSGRGLLVIKDFTSVLSMHRDARSKLISALREIHDGYWVRDVGAEGGMKIPWSGRLVIIGACTTAWDAHREVVAAMGDRFLVVRQRIDRNAAGRQAISNVGSERTMRAELGAAVRDILARPLPDPLPRVEDTAALLGLADLVTRCRTPVERDYQGKPAWAHDLEAPTRFVKQLIQLARGGLSLGMTQDAARQVATRAARDSMPPVYLAVLGDLAAAPRSAPADAARRLRMAWSTVDRAIEELHLLRCLQPGVNTVEEDLADVVKLITRKVGGTGENTL